MRQTVWRWGRVLGPAVVLGVLVWRLGTGPFLTGVRAVDGRALAAAAGIALLTTVCCAWRWQIVARGLGVPLSLPAAVAAYYRSVFLNVTLPGGVVGDVHRGVSHGRDVRDVSRGLRAVVWERSAGQVVQAFLTVAVLLVLPSPWRWPPPSSRRGRGPGAATRRGRACGARWRATCVVRYWAAGPGRRSRSLPRWSSPATRSRS